MSDIYKDPMVIEALKSGRHSADIAVLMCPRCGEYSYYNQGSHFSCHLCFGSWYCCSEDENPPPGIPHLCLDEVLTVADVANYDPDTDCP